MNTTATRDYRILYREGPGDRFRVWSRRISSSNFLQALQDLNPIQPGNYLVQDTATLECKLFVVKVEPTITEL